MVTFRTVSYERGRGDHLRVAVARGGDYLVPAGHLRGEGFDQRQLGDGLDVGDQERLGAAEARREPRPWWKPQAIPSAGWSRTTRCWP